MAVTRFIITILMLISVFNYSGCKSIGDADENVVAEYLDGKKITYEELNKYVNDWYKNRRFSTNTEKYKDALNTMLKNQLKRVDFFEKHLDTNKVLIQSINRSVNEELVALYFEKQYISKYTTDEFVRNVYNSMDKRVVYQEIILNRTKDATKSELAEIENKILEIKSEIEKGTDFNKLVQKYSEDMQSVQNNGYASPVAWMQSIYDPIGEIIFNLKKNDVHVLSTAADIRIIKVAEINKIELQPYEKMKDKVIDDIKQVYSEKLIEEFNTEKNALVDTKSLRWNEAAIKQLVIWSDIPNFYNNSYEDTLATAISNSDNKIILTYNNGQVDYKKYLKLLNNFLTLNIDRKINGEDIKNFIIDAVTTEALVKKADSLDLRKEVFNAYTENPVIKDRLVYLYNQAEIEQKIPPLTEENLYKFFKDNEESIFYQLEKRTIYAMLFDNQVEAKNVYEKINSGVEFEKVTGRYFVKSYIKERDGKLKTYLGIEQPIFAQKGFNMKLDEVSAPINFIDENEQTKYAVLKCKNIRAEKQLTYDEAKNIINEKFKNYYRVKIENEIEKKLTEKYHPKYYYDVLSKMISQNNEKQ